MVKEDAEAVQGYDVSGMSKTYGTDDEQSIQRTGEAFVS